MSEGYASYHDFYLRGPYAPYLKEHRLAGSAPVMMVKAAQPAGDFSDPGMPELVLHAPSSALARVDFGAGRWSGRPKPGSLFLAPPDCASGIVVDEPHEVAFLGVSFAALRPMLIEAAPNFSDFGQLHAGPFHDDLIEALWHRLWAEAAQGSPLGQLFADSAVQTLVFALLRRAGLAKPVSEVSRDAPLAPWRLRRVLDYVEANLHRDIGVTELAGVVGMSSRHFTRGFAMATGEPPYRYVIRLRVERAKELLHSTDLPVVEVALACGFSDQSKLSAAFRRAVGTTPGAYRRAA